MGRPWWPFVEVCRDGIRRAGHITAPPHVRVYRLLYSRWWDWGFYSGVRHLVWRFWWVRGGVR
jgi:hypothetical protein